MPRILAVLGMLGLLAYPSAGQLVADMIDAPVELGAPVTEIVGKQHVYTAVSAEPLPIYTGIALQGIATGDSLNGWIRFSTDDAWGEWLPLYIVRSYTDAAFLAAYRGNRVMQADAFELRFEVDASGSTSVVVVGTFLDEVSIQRDDGYDPLPQATNFVITPPNLRDRAEWGAEPFRGTPVRLNQPNYHTMTLHHTAGFGAVTLTEGLEQVKRIQDFHQNGRGWSDIGYHYLMDQEGRLYQGRPWYNTSVRFEDGPPLVRGAHVGGNNTGNIGVSLMGCYHPPEGSNCRHVMTEPAKDSLVVTFAYLSERYQVDPGAMRGHRDFSSTSCPGDNNYGQLSTFRSRVADLLITGNAPLGTAALSATADSIGVVALQWRFLANAGIVSYVIEREVAGAITPLLERTGVSDGEWIDTAVLEPGLVTYLLTARGVGREQTLSRAAVQVGDRKETFLAQSFPNPADQQATIRYFLQDPGIVSLVVYDTAGRAVTRLSEQYRDEGAWHSVTFDTGRLAAGTYYYQLSVEGFTDTVFQSMRPFVVVH